MEWAVQRICTDVDDYELIVEHQKTDWTCDQKVESWKWSVVYHGTIVASGSVNDMEEAKQKAEANIPSNTPEQKSD